MRPLLFLAISLFFVSCAVTKSATKKTAQSAAAYQADLNAKYLDPARTILSAEDLATLKEKGGLPFYPINDAYRVTADFKRYSQPEIIEFKTSTTRLVDYAAFGLATFELNGATHSLTLYRSTAANLPLEYRNSLFLPMRDQTSGDETYGGGRYLDIEIPEGDKIVIDFNKTYHPYCAYTLGYSCPVPPAENYLETRVEAGIKMVDLGGH
ncbi:DUF1684 domain-containing protein [Neolewinella agarilytica]|uniref:DUF1684 domain-containing protein n=1 Tax=Neolewinella agarilytica TaxID=478744 RepID=A0A1H9CDJ0_9BACT|nr:DUF1684 domain-containing protein [Neolewinella agarilytica]SEP98843.1 hypothetical protein SAMN05444359_104147 [Neolewinella agarilytica]